VPGGAGRAPGGAISSTFSPAVAGDVICVLLFAIVGRSSHAEANDLRGVLHTAWPFLAGCLLGLTVSRSWRHPVSLPTGVVVWLCTVGGGIALRLASGDTAQLPFVVVATLTLALLLVGWRALLRLVQRARSRHADRAPV
jgi:peptidoglycan/LPS O-acetylase OafA/YrhL